MAKSEKAKMEEKIDALTVEFMEKIQELRSEMRTEWGTRNVKRSKKIKELQGELYSVENSLDAYPNRLRETLDKIKENPRSERDWQMYRYYTEMIAKEQKRLLCIKAELYDLQNAETSIEEQAFSSNC